MLKRLYRFPILNIILVLIITAIMGYGLTKLETENNLTEMLPKDNKVYLDDHRIMELYGVSDAMLVGVESKSGRILTVENLKTIEEITGEIENIRFPRKEAGLPPSTEEPEAGEEESYDELMDEFEDESAGLEDELADFEESAPVSDEHEVIDDVISLTRVEIIEGVEGGLEPVSLEDIIPTDEEELAAFKAKLLSWEIFENLLYSKDLSATAISVVFTEEATDHDKEYLNDKLHEIVKSRTNSDLKYYIAGEPAINTTLVQYIPKDLKRLVPFVIIVLLLILLISFKNIRDVLLPLITVIISVIWTMGLMGYLGFKLTIIGVVIPVLLIAIGSAYGIHIITHYIEEKNRAKCTTKEENRATLLLTVRKVVFPVFLTSLTTFFGFLSLISMEITFIKEFGVFVAIGVIIEFLLSIYLIPSIMLLFKPRKEKLKFDKEHTPFLELLLIRLARFLKNRKGLILVAFAIFILILLNGALKVNVDFNTLKFFKADSEVVTSTHFIDDNLAGSNTISLNIRGKEDGDLTHPDILQAMDGLAIHLVNKYDEIGKVVGFNDMIRRMNQVMHYPEGEEYERLMESSISYEELLLLLNRVNKTTDSANPDFNQTLEAINRGFNYNGAAYNEIPTDPAKYNITDEDLRGYAEEKGLDLSGLNEVEREKLKKEILKQLVSQYLILYSGSMDKMIATDQMNPKMARLTISLKQAKSAVLKDILAEIESYTAENFPPGYTIEMGGTTMITNELNNIVVNGQILSFIIAILIVFIIISLSYRSAVAGLISIIPIITSILINFAIMGYFNLDLNIATALIASLSIGIGIDYTIHFLSFYKENWQKYRDVDRAIEQTFYTSGKAILYNAVSVGLGFAVLLFSSTRILGTFGILITIVMLSSSLGALTIVPIILEMFRPKFLEK